MCHCFPAHPTGREELHNSFTPVFINWGLDVFGGVSCKVSEYGRMSNDERRLAVEITIDDHPHMEEPLAKPNTASA